MPRAFSTDLRERALAACEAGGGSQARGPRLFRMGERTLSGWLRAAREEGRRSPRPRRGGRPPLGGEREALAALVAERNDATLAEYADLLAERAGVRRSPAAAVPGAPGARPGAEERTLEAAEQDREDVAEARAAWRAELAGVDPARLVFVDETGIDTRTTRTYARAGKGRRAVGQVPWGRWERLTVIGALALDGVGREPQRRRRDRHGGLPRLHRGGPRPRAARPAGRDRGDGQPRAHKAEKVRAALDRAGLAHRYLPPYSPDMNPIEPAWSKLKARLRAVGARSREALEAALGPALAAITAGRPGLVPPLRLPGRGLTRNPL